MTSGDKIAKLRKENNLTQEQLGDLLCVSRQSISKWESNLAFPETMHLIELSKIFNCSIDYLLKEENTKENPTHSINKESQIVGIVKRHWRKIYIPLYYAGFITLLMGFVILAASNIYFDAFSNIIGNSMFESYKNIFTIFGIVDLVISTILIVVATILLVKERKAHKM